MDADNQKRSDVFHRAWEIICQDDSIRAEEKEGVLKLIQALIEAAESAPSSNAQDGSIKTFSQEIVSKHSLMTMVKQQANELDALRRLSLNLTSSLNLQTVLESVVAEAMALVRDARQAHIFLYSDGNLAFGASSLNKDPEGKQTLSMPRPHGVTQFVAENGEQIIVEDTSVHSLYKDAYKDWVGSVISVPLKFDNRIVGVMNLSRSITGKFTKSELRLIGLLADQAAVAISNASAHKTVSDLANTDRITGLPNRRALDERLQEELRYAKRMKTQFSVVMMDLDGFKNVNDTFGHAVGDELLRSLFNHLASHMRATDFLARYGGDELTLVMRDANMEVAKKVAEKITNLVKEFKFAFPDSKKPHLGITAGVAMYPTHSRNAGDLLRAADAALYQGKKHHRGSFVVAKIVTGPLGAETIIAKKSDFST